MIYGLYTSTVYRICTNFYMLTFAFITTPTAHPPGQRHPSGRPPRRPSPPLQHRQPPQDDSPAAGSAAAAAGTSPAGTARSLHLRRHLRRAVLDGACGWRSPAAPAAGRLRQRLRRAGEPTYHTVAGGAFGGRVWWRRRDSLPPYLRWRLRQAGAGSVRRGLELGAEVGRRLRWNLAAL